MALGITMEDIGWHHGQRRFVDGHGAPITHCFKMYPTQWMLDSPFGGYLLGGTSTTQWIEPPWKLLADSKALLPVLWEMFPGHPNLLEASFEPGRFATDFVKKPIYSREGANVAITADGRTIEAPGEYGEEGFIWQAYGELGRFDGNYAVIGSWVVGGEPAGIGIREDDTPITKDTSRFVPHYFA